MKDSPWQRLDSKQGILHTARKTQNSIARAPASDKEDLQLCIELPMGHKEPWIQLTETPVVLQNNREQ